MDPIISLVRAGCVYPDGFRALSDLELSVNTGECVGIIGSNGAGKTTLLSLLAGLILPSEGSVRVRGIPVQRDTLTALRQGLGFVFQDPDDQLFMPTVLEDILFGLRARGTAEADAQTAARRVLEQVGIGHLKDRFPWKLSGGEKRSAAIAAALAPDPELLILDEPTAGLDPRSRRNLIRLLRDLKVTRVVTSHDLDFILEVCDRVVLLHQGLVVAEGPAGVLLRDEARLESCNLELPQALRSCPVCGSHREPPSSDLS